MPEPLSWRIWTRTGALVGAGIGAAWGMVLSGDRGMVFSGDMFIFLALFSALPGAIGGLMMSLLAPRIPSRVGRILTATILGELIGVLLVLPSFADGSWLFTTPSGAIGGWLSAEIVEGTNAARAR